MGDAGIDRLAIELTRLHVKVDRLEGKVGRLEADVDRLADELLRCRHETIELLRGILALLGVDIYQHASLRREVLEHLDGHYDS